MKGKRWVALLLTVLLLAGCNVQNGGSGQETTAATETLPTQATAAATEPVETTQPPLVLEAVTELFSRKTSSGVEICVLDYRTVALITGEYVGEGFSTYQTQVCLNDIYTDTPIAETVLNGEYKIVSSYADSIALSCEKNGHILILDRELKQTGEIKTKEYDGIVTSGTAYHYLWGNGLYCMDIATGEAQKVELKRELPLVELLDFDPLRNLLMCTAFVDPYTVGTCTAVIDLNTNSFAFLSSDYVTGELTQKGFYLQGESVLHKADAFYGSWESQTLNTMDDFCINDGKISTWHIPGTDYLYRLTYDKNQIDQVAKAELFRMGETFEVCKLPQPLDDVKAKLVLPLPDGNLLVLASNRRNYRVYLICPDQLTFTPAEAPQSAEISHVDETVYTVYEQAAVTGDVAGHLAEVREEADSLEEEYGVTILMSNQCAAAVKSSGMTVTTTDQANMNNEAAWIDSALDQMEEAFGLYPEGFFRQFRNEAQQKGILVLLIEEISDDLNIIGFHYVMGDWYIVAVDITSGEVLSTYCHEFWHATENKIQRENQLMLDDGSWSLYNPEGYTYSYDSTPGYINDLDNTLFNNEPDSNIYFIDPYGKTNPREDRARLMEFVMCSDYYATRISTIPALRNKLKAMSDAVREYFDTTGWDTPRWEKYTYVTSDHPNGV